MIVIVIMGVLAAVAVPNLFGVIERSREKLDLMKLWYVKNAVERNLIGHDFFSTFPKVTKLDTILYFITDSTCVPENPEMVPRELRLALGNLS